MIVRNGYSPHCLPHTDRRNPNRPVAPLRPPVFLQPGFYLETRTPKKSVEVTGSWHLFDVVHGWVALIAVTACVVVCDRQLVSGGLGVQEHGEHVFARLGVGNGRWREHEMRA